MVEWPLYKGRVSVFCPTMPCHARTSRDMCCIFWHTGEYSVEQIARSVCQLNKVGTGGSGPVGVALVQRVWQWSRGCGSGPVGVAVVQRVWQGVAVVQWVWQWSSGRGSGLEGVAVVQWVMRVTAHSLDCPLSEAAEVQDGLTATGAGEGWGHCSHDLT